ncbi:hypothetical protein BDY17DRAFT_195020 [Neohortaea acidophila]|uniref:Uncharacterized protein n=1 Tax=Neohortaea acidophila TaxID=245834 RepID=A0A6A6PKJ0_9PEZI|nr:uncharacterized protein BDY17DRAFT_195020 [Neohortaea acidophila]KAF2480570.1 hypothetical protein BDY17DRAFT_195020 [Neohortaea acidophila]
MDCQALVLIAICCTMNGILPSGRPDHTLWPISSEYRTHETLEDVIMSPCLYCALSCCACYHRFSTMRRQRSDRNTMTRSTAAAIATSSSLIILRPGALSLLHSQRVPLLSTLAVEFTLLSRAIGLPSLNEPLIFFIPLAY